MRRVAKLRRHTIEEVTCNGLVILIFSGETLIDVIYVILYEVRHMIVEADRKDSAVRRKNAAKKAGHEHEVKEEEQVPSTSPAHGNIVRDSSMLLGSCLAPTSRVPEN